MCYMKDGTIYKLKDLLALCNEYTLNSVGFVEPLKVLSVRSDFV